MGSVSEHDIPEPVALKTAVRMLRAGLWPVPIHAPGDVIVDEDGGRKVSVGKEPIGKAWGARKKSEAALRAVWAANPKAGVGIKLGCDAGVIDVEIDDPRGEDTLVAMMGGEVVPTMGWGSRRGQHRLYSWDDRLKAYGKSVLKVGGVELRFGALTPGGQFQSVIPPSPDAEGNPRTWSGPNIIAPLPDAFFAYLDEHFAPTPAAEAGEPPAETIPIRGVAGGRPSAEERAVYYLAKCEPAISGQKGHDKTFGVACRFGPGFDLPPDVAHRLLMEHYNPRCVPPWSEKEARHKIDDAYRVETRRGWLLHADRTDRTDRTAKDRSSDPGSVRCVRSVTEEEEWEPPFVPPAIEPAPFPLDVFPYSLAELCRQASRVMHCPPDYLGAAALGLAGGVIGRSACLRLKRGWEEGANLYLAIIGEAGSRKSPALKLLARAVWRIDQELRLKYRAEAAEYRMAKIKGNSAGDPPVRLHLALDDATREAVAQAHSHNPRGVILIKDELTGWVAALNSYKGGKGDDKQFWLSLNTGTTAKATRKGNQEDLFIPHSCGAVVGCLTPSTLPILGDSRFDDGWLDRILFCYPEPRTAGRRWSEDEVDPELIEDWTKAIRRLWDFPMRAREDGGTGPWTVELSKEARAIWASWYDAHQVEQEDPEFPPTLVGPWSKIEGFTARMALILSRLAWAFDPLNPRDVLPVDGLALHGATKLADYFKNHFRRARRELIRRPDGLPWDALCVLRWILSERRESFTARDVIRAFRRFETADRDEALRVLERHRYIRRRAEPPRGEGRPASPTFDVNPHVFPKDTTDTTDTTTEGDD